MNEKIVDFINYLRVEKNCSPNTLSSYQKDIQQFTKETCITSPSDITKYKIREFLSKLSDYEMKARTRKRKLASIRSFCKFLYTEGHIANNPALDIQNPKIEKNLPVVFTMEETANVIDSAGSDRDKAILEVLYGTGVRVAELVRMKLSDIDLANGRVKVFGKGSKERNIPINRQAVLAIKQYVDNRKNDSDFLFPSPKSSKKPLTPKAVYNIVKKYSEANGISTMSPHKLRHCYATHLNMNGVDIQSLKELLGHADISTTTIYTHLANEQITKSYHSAHPRG